MTNEELRRLAMEATPGPWEKVGMSYYHFQIHGKGRNGHESERICMTTDAVSNDAPADVREANAAYIAAASPDVVLSLIADLDALRVRLAEVEKDAARLNWIQRHLFVHKWNGVIDSGSQTRWDIWGGYRHITATMIGNTFGEAIDNAAKEQA